MVHVVLHITWKDRFQKLILVNRVLEGRRSTEHIYITVGRKKKPILQRKKKRKYVLF